VAYNGRKFLLTNFLDSCLNFRLPSRIHTSSGTIFRREMKMGL
jgi:hypothetical protein